MANKKFSDLDNMGVTAPAADDGLAWRDKSDTTESPTGTTKRWEWLDFLRELFATRFGSDAGSTDTYIVTLAPAPAAYVTGEHYRFKANTANTGACTVNFNGLGAKTIKKATGGITTDLADNDIRAGQWVDLVYDGTNMQMQSLLGNAPAGGAGGIGDVVGPASATNNAIARYDSTTGKLIQDSPVTVGDDGEITIPEIAAPATPAAGKVVVYAKSDNKVYRKGEDGVEAELGGAGSIAPLTLIDANTVHQKNGSNSQTFKIFADATNGLQFSNPGSSWNIASNNVIVIDSSGRTYTFGTSAFLSAVDLGSTSVPFTNVVATQSNTAGPVNILNSFGGTGPSLQSTGTNGILQLAGVSGGLDGGQGIRIAQHVTIRRSASGATLEIKNGADSGYTGIRAQSLQSNAVTVANLPASPVEGMLVAVTDSSTATWGATITGGGANHVLAYYNGTNWTVAAI